MLMTGRKNETIFFVANLWTEFSAHNR